MKSILALLIMLLILISACTYEMMPVTDIKPLPDMSSSAVPVARHAKAIVLKKIMADHNDGLSTTESIYVKTSFALGTDFHPFGKKGDRVWQVHRVSFGQTTSILWVNAETKAIKIIYPQNEKKTKQSYTGNSLKVVSDVPQGTIQDEYIGSMYLNHSDNILYKEFTYPDLGSGWLVFQMCGTRFGDNTIPDIKSLHMTLELFDAKTTNFLQECELYGTNMTIANWYPPCDSFICRFDSHEYSAIKTKNQYIFKATVNNPVSFTNQVKIWIQGLRARR
jgi:hypothetical protein